MIEDRSCDIDPGFLSKLFLPLLQCDGPLGHLNRRGPHVHDIPHEGSGLTMDAMILRGLVAVESAPASLPSAPERAVQRTYHHGTPQRELSIELSRLQRPLTSPSVSCAARPPSAGSGSPAGTPREELVDLEMSRPATPAPRGAAVEALQTVWNPYMNRFRFLAVCLLNFGNGINDSAPGALLPYLET